MNVCSYCGEIRKSEKSRIGHEVYCHSNPNRKIKKPSYGMKGKKGSNQFIKAKENGMPIPEGTMKGKPGTFKGKTHTNDTKEKISKSRSVYLEEVGGGGFTHIKFYNLKNINGEEFVLRGTWELEVAKIFNEHKILWVRKKYINYVDEYEKTYCPDFYLPSQDAYVEVKGYFSERDERKLKLVQEQNKISLILLKGKSLEDIKRECHLLVKIPVLYTGQGGSIPPTPTN